MQREIGIIIRVKDAAKAKEEIKSIVDNRLLGNVKTAGDSFKKMGDEVATSGRKARGAKDDFSSFFGGLAKGAGILYTLKRGLTAAFGSFEAGASLERASVQFENSIGNINTMLPQLRAATRGTVEDMQLLKTANRAVMEGLNPKNLTKMYQMATVASRKLGMESEQAIQTISNAITAQDESALKTLGTILKTNIGYKVQTAIISKNAGVMSGAAAIAIRQSVIMAELNKRFGGFNQLQEDGVEVIQQFRAAMSNLRATLGPVIGIVLSPLLKIVTSISNGMSVMLTLLKDNKSFRMAAQGVGMVLAALASVKTLAVITSLVGKIALFALGIKGLGIALASLAGFTLLSQFVDIGKALQFAGTALSVFYQLVSSYNETTGISRVLEKDKNEIGDFYKVVRTLAQAYVLVSTIIKSAYAGLGQTFRDTADAMGAIKNNIMDIPILGNILRSLGDAASSAGRSISDFFDSLSLNRLEGISRLIKKIAEFAPLALLVRQVGNLLPTAPTPSPTSRADEGSSISPQVPPRDTFFPTPQNQTPTDAALEVPAIREQNMQAGSPQEDYLPALLKTMNRMADSNEALLQREDSKEVQRRMSPIPR